MHHEIDVLLNPNKFSITYVFHDWYKGVWSGKICNLIEQFPLCDACSLPNASGRWVQISRERGCHSHRSIHAANIALSRRGWDQLRLPVIKKAFGPLLVSGCELSVVDSAKILGLTISYGTTTLMRRPFNKKANKRMLVISCLTSQGRLPVF